MKGGRPNIREVAAVAGVSISAASLALNGKPGVSATKRARVLQTVQELGYVRNGSSGSSAGTRVLGVLMESLSIPSAHDRFYAEIVTGIEDAAQRLGYRLLLHLYRPGVDPIDDIRALMGRDIEGLIIANGGDVTDELIARIADGRMPLVLVENYVSENVHAVIADNFTAGLQVTEHLIRLGHRRIGALPGPVKYKSLVDRMRGYTIALLENGIEPDLGLQPAPRAGHPRKGYVQMQQLLALPEPPTAVFAVSDKTAFGAMEAIKDAGLRIPDDVSIAAVDDVYESPYASPPLTTFHVPKRSLGEAAVNTLHALLDSPNSTPAAKIVLIGHVVLRQSCAPPRGT
ncbi:MAG: LacI family DNA-binding transcriptional regulator [Chloroflexi bacterium]|nr:LacI family DNA-binding transcriptional regulator [Chloroflexota bacterium]